ncbi:MAG TPA: 2-hydroxyacyl-CoA dehydratase family protein [Spirochaetota bacterium]|nr:2-hydroxyacyl-CoA dehydratase family protein [Spirochaetota bacterium]
MDRFLESMREQLGQWGTIARGHAVRTENRLVGTVCDALPREILAAFGVEALRVPILVTEGGSTVSPEDRIAAALQICDCVIVPEGCAAYRPALELNTGRIIQFSHPHGYGEDAAIALHHSLDSLLQRLGFKNIDQMDPERLAIAVAKYDAVRRLARGIASVRHTRRDALLPSNLMMVFEAAGALPPAVVTEALAGMLDALNACPASDVAPVGRTVLVRGGLIRGADVLDDIERAGCVVSEDDSCNGRRQFDVSHNPASRNLYYEMLDALSYRPLCPSLRPPRERFDLFYRDLKNYGIGMVVFLRDTMDEIMLEEIESLRIRLMRTGVDPIVVDSEGAGRVLSAYLAATDTPSP